MARRRNSIVSSTVLPLLLLQVFFIGQITKVDSLEVSVFPHYQTFDSWDNCNYDGTCYELYCTNLKGGWVNPEFHSNVAPYTLEVRSWWVINGPTTSNRDANNNPFPCDSVQTGPCYDHTGGANGKYLYSEASACFGYYFRVNTPTIIYTAANASFSFYYYMYGADLNVPSDEGVDAYLIARMTLDNGTNWVELLRHDRDAQFNSTSNWAFFSVVLDSYFPSIPTPSAPIVANFQFEARTGGERSSNTYWKSDIALDDVLWTQAGASSILDPYIDPITNGTGTVNGDGGDGISDGEIAGIVVGVVGGLGALCCCLLLLLLLLLLAISPRGPKKGGAAPAGDDL